MKAAEKQLSNLLKNTTKQKDDCLHLSLEYIVLEICKKRDHLFYSAYFNPILHTAWLDNKELTLKSNTAKYYSSFLHTFLKFFENRGKSKAR